MKLTICPKCTGNVETSYELCSDLNCALTAATETVLRTWAANGVPGAVEELARREVAPERFGAWR